MERHHFEKKSIYVSEQTALPVFKMLGISGYPQLLFQASAHIIEKFDRAWLRKDVLHSFSDKVWRSIKVRGLLSEPTFTLTCSSSGEKYRVKRTAWQMNLVRWESCADAFITSQVIGSSFQCSFPKKISLIENRLLSRHIHNVKSNQWIPFLFKLSCWPAEVRLTNEAIP